MTNVSSNVCSLTYVLTLPVVSGKPYVPPKPVSDSGEPGHKRKYSGSSSDFSCGEIWVEFQHFMAFRLLSRSQSPRGYHSHSPDDRYRSPSSSCLACHWSPRRPACTSLITQETCLLSLACLSCLTSTTCFTSDLIPVIILASPPHLLVPSGPPQLPACPSLPRLLVPVDLCHQLNSAHLLALPGSFACSAYFS